MSEKTCILWPDVVPRVDVTGRKMGLLTFIHPVGVVDFGGPRFRKWFWLTECKCGNEIITSHGARRTHCGCVTNKTRNERRKVTRAIVREVTVRKQFNRGEICLRKPYFMCEHYFDCQDERIEKNVKVSSRYRVGGGCYTPTKEQRSLEEGGHE